MSTVAQTNHTLTTVGLTCGYHGVPVVTEVDLAVDTGEIVGVAGRNGAGKTTLLRTISGVNRRLAGAVTLDGGELSSAPDRIARAGIAHVPEGRRLFGQLDALANLRVAAYAAGVALDEAAMGTILGVFPMLEQHLGRRAGLMSGGQQQMVAIARGIAAHPKFLLIDELSLGLAPVVTEELMHALRRLVAEYGIGVVIVDQNVRMLAQHCSRVYVVSEGRVEGIEDADDVRLSGLYLGEG